MNLALTSVSSVLSLLMWRLCLLRRDLPLPSLVSEVPWFFDMLLLRATAVFSRTKVGHECHEGCHRFRLFLDKVPGEPLVADVVLKSCWGLCFRTDDDLIFLCEEPCPELPGRFLWLLNYVAQVIGIWWSHISALKVVENAASRSSQQPMDSAGKLLSQCRAGPLSLSGSI